jgi:hypothetical protein
VGSGSHGEVTVMNLPDGRVEVRTRYRDWDGKARLVSVRAASRSAAQAELKKWPAQRNVFQPIDTMLCLDSLFGELVTYWLADLDLEGRIAPSTSFNYERDMTKLVLPAFEHLTLREIGVARLHKPKRTPTAVTATEVNAIRAVIKAWEHRRGTSGPNPDGQLGQVVEVMLGTSARIGEVLAIRRTCAASSARCWVTQASKAPTRTCSAAPSPPSSTTRPA